MDHEEPTSFLDHVHLGCTQRECKLNEIILDEYSKQFESRILVQRLKNDQGVRNVTQKMLRGRTTMEGHAKKGVERYCELANKTEQLNCTKSQLLAWMAKKNFKEDELESVRVLSKVCSQIVLGCLKLGTYWKT